MPIESVNPRFPARKTRVIETTIFHTLVRPAIRRMFYRVALFAPHGEDWSGLPTLFYSNHVSWWDGYLAFFLARERWRLDGYLMMEEAQLRRYRFFQCCGCFSVNRYEPREAMRSIAYTARLLRKHSKRAVWIFPQGAITPNDRRPLETFAGAAHIARRATPVRCVPVAIRLEFLGEQRPEALIRLGQPHVAEAGDTRLHHAEMSRRLLAEVEALHDDVNSGASARYSTVLRGGASINVLWDRLRGVAAP